MDQANLTDENTTPLKNETILSPIEKQFEHELQESQIIESHTLKIQNEQEEPQFKSEDPLDLSLSVKTQTNLSTSNQ
jgi:hypothetical protein